VPEEHAEGPQRPRTEIAADMKQGTRSARSQNRVATKSYLHELGFIGVRVSMDARDYALIDLRNVPEKRRKVAEAYFEHTGGFHAHPELDGYQWGSEI